MRNGDELASGTGIKSCVDDDVDGAMSRLMPFGPRPWSKGSFCCWPGVAWRGLAWLGYSQGLNSEMFGWAGVCFPTPVMSLAPRRALSTLTQPRGIKGISNCKKTHVDNKGSANIQLTLVPRPSSCQQTHTCTRTHGSHTWSIDIDMCGSWLSYPGALVCCLFYLVIKFGFCAVHIAIA